MRRALLLSVLLVAGLAEGREPLPQTRAAPELASMWPCAPGASGICSESTGDYLAFAHHLAPAVDLQRCSKAKRRELNALFHRWRRDEPAWEYPPPETLPSLVRERVGIDPYLAQLESEPPVVEVVRTTTWRGAPRQDLFVRTPWIGRVPAALVHPRAPDDGLERPVVVLVPGHHWGAEQVLDAYAEGLLARGIAVLALTLRGYGAGPLETEATLAMLCSGASMVLVRQLEILSALRWLDLLQEEGVFTAIGVMGHSGGGVAANLLGFYAPAVDAVATDFPGDFFDVAQRPGPREPARFVLDETHPELSLLRWALRDPAASPVPTLIAPYGFGLGPHAAPGAVVEYPAFFVRHLFRGTLLRAEVPPSSAPPAPDPPRSDAP